MTRLTVHPDSYHAVFAPQKELIPGAGEEMTLEIYKTAGFVAMNDHDLYTLFSTAFLRSCRGATTINLIKQEKANVVFQEMGERCGPHKTSQFLARLARGKDNLSFLGYRVNLDQMPPILKARMLDYINAAKLDTSAASNPEGSPGSASPSAAPSSQSTKAP